MTARANTPQSNAIMAKRADRAPKKKRTVRGANNGRGVEVARSRGLNTANYAEAELVSPDKPLTDKQKAFVKLWAEGESIMTASVRAGFSDGGTVAYRLVRMPNVLKLRDEYAAKYREEAQMDRKRVMDGILEAIEMARLMSEPMTMIAGWREVGKLCNFYAPIEHRVKVDVSGNIVHQRLNSMSDADLLKAISEGGTDVRAVHSV